MNRNIAIPFEVIERFALKNGLSVEYSIQLHDDLLHYLDNTLVEQHSSPSMLIDEVWHSFILHTQLYNQFCKARYGHFIHHLPTSAKFDEFSKVPDIIAAMEKNIREGMPADQALSHSECRCSDCESQAHTQTKVMVFE